MRRIAAGLIVGLALGIGETAAFMQDTPPATVPWVLTLIYGQSQ
jgi:hypothetical protein